MCHTRTAFLFAAACASLSPAPSAAGVIPEMTDSIPNYVLNRPGVAAAGQPSPEVVARLKELGFGTVINVRGAVEPGFVDEASAIFSAQQAGRDGEAAWLTLAALALGFVAVWATEILSRRRP